jgi:hypothetical protein
LNNSASTLTARFVIDIERGRIDGDCIVKDGPLTEADHKHLGIGSIFDAPTCSGSHGLQERPRSCPER